MAELDAIKRERIGGLMLCRDWGDRRPWPTWPQPDRRSDPHEPQGKEIIRAAGLREELTFTSFRHGGFTEAGDAELTDREIMAQGRHKSARYCPSTSSAPCGRSRPAPKNGAQCERTPDNCQNERQPACQNGPMTMAQVLENIGAGEGNRTLVISLEGFCSTIELHPQRAP